MWVCVYVNFPLCKENYGLREFDNVSRTNSNRNWRVTFFHLQTIVSTNTGTQFTRIKYTHAQIEEKLYTRMENDFPKSYAISSKMEFSSFFLLILYNVYVKTVYETGSVLLNDKIFSHQIFPYIYFYITHTYTNIGPLCIY